MSAFIKGRKTTTCSAEYKPQFWSFFANLSKLRQIYDYARLTRLNPKHSYIAKGKSQMRCHPGELPSSAILPAMIRLVLFDIDGTLVHTGGAGIKAFEKYSKPNSTPMTVLKN